MKKWLMLTLLPVFFLTGCNTIRGLGTDIMKIGSTIQNSADRAHYKRQIRKQNLPQTYNQYDNYTNQQLPQPVIYNNY